ncbi:hypothetical protein K502DRAFT_323303 [Neoconidiobolus thromboides FSU 785]|nr:hypothetical protein K502DRAFT_323303 [Neoconidiobolus thromboides FSU 785]
MQFTKFLTTFALIASTTASFTPNTECRPLLGNAVLDCGLPSDLLHISKVSITPQVPVRGQKITVTLTGELSDEIPDGTTAHVIAKNGDVTVIDKSYNFCTVVGSGQNKCPIKKGPVTTTKEIEIPAGLPDGSYIIDGTINTPAKKQVAHIQLKVTFKS